MKVISRILYYCVLVVIILTAAFNLLQKAVISPVVKKHIINRIGPAVNADDFDVGKISLGMNRLSVHDIIYEKENVRIVFKKFGADFSLSETLLGLITFKGIRIKLDVVNIEGCEITVNPETRPSGEEKWEFNFKDFQKTADFLKENDYIGQINLSGLDVTYISDLGLPLVRDMSGRAGYTPDGKILVRLDGRFLNSQNNNLFLEGDLNTREYSARFDLGFESDEIINFRSPFGIFSASEGRYGGNARLEINNNSDEGFYLSGNFDLSGLRAVFKRRLFLEDAGLQLSYYNGAVSIAGLNGRINGLPFTGKGRVFGIMSPNGDMFLDFEDIKGRDILDAAAAYGIFAPDHNAFELGDRNFLSLHVSGNLTDPEIGYRIKSGSMKAAGIEMSGIGSTGVYRGGRLDVKEIKFLSSDMAVAAEGAINGLLSKHPDHEFLFKATGALFKNFPFLNSEYLKNQSTLITGTMKGSGAEITEMKATLNSFDFSRRQNDKKLSADLSMKNNVLRADVYNPSSQLTAALEYNMLTGVYELSGGDICALSELVYGKSFIKDRSIGFRLAGNRQRLSLRAGSSDQNSVFWGEMSAGFELGGHYLESVINWTPGSVAAITRPLSLRFRKTGRNVSISDIFIDNIRVHGNAGLNLYNLAVSGDLDLKNVDAGILFRSDAISTGTDVSLKIRGRLPDLRTDIYINESGAKYQGSSGDTLVVSGNARCFIVGDSLVIESADIFRDRKKIMSLKGEVRSFRDIDLSVSGIAGAEIFNVFFEGHRFTGGIDYKADITGSLIKPRLKKTEIIFTEGTVNNEKIYKAELSASELDSTGVLVKKFTLDAGRYLNIDAEGFLPYGDSDPGIFFTGNFYGDFLGYFQKRTGFFSGAYSLVEGKFTLGGSYRSLRIRDMEVYVVDGGFDIGGLRGGFDRIRSKMTVGEDSKLEIAVLNMRSRATGGRISIKNSFSDKDYDDIIIPGDINIGHLMISSTDRGFEYSVPGMMLEGDYGNFVPGGFSDEYLRVFKDKENITASGTVLLRNSKITFPFLKRKIEKTADEEKDSADILKNIGIDVEFIPGQGNSYFYNLDIEARSVWGRIKKSFRRLDDELNNVLVNIVSDRRGLRVKGILGDPKSLELSGTLRGRNGTCNFSAFTFRVNDVSVTFDGRKNIRGYTDPYLRAVGRTTVKTKADSTGYSGYENVYVKVVSADAGTVTDSDGARISALSIILTDEYGNLWMEREENITGIDTRATVMEMFNEAFDARLFSPFISPIEYALGKMLGASVSIRPSISRNFIQKELGLLDIPEHYADYFLGSEFFVSKFLTEDLAVTWNSKYIGTEEYLELTEREYGYRNRLSLDYMINNHIFTSAGYEYDSIKEGYGYNIALMYRYRFFNVSEPYNYIKNFMRLK